jgi:hypothetical protein
MSPYILDSNADSTNNKLKCKESTLYKMINYEKNYVCFDDQETGKYRSVIFSKSSDEIRLVSFSPPKSIPLSVFKSKHPTVNSLIPEEIEITEIIEGTMIQLFYDPSIGSWNIATKSAIGCDYSYYRTNYDNHHENHDENIGENMGNITFREMFMEAIREHKDFHLNNSWLVENLNKKYCYNFVLQHPKNHIVLSIEVPRVYLVAIYEIESSNSARLLPLYSTVSNTPELKRLNDYQVFFLPKIHDFSNYITPSIISGQLYYRCYEALELVKEITSAPLGYMLVDIVSGDRTSIGCDYYERLKEIRGNHPNLQYQYLCLLRTKKLNEFLEYFPMYKNLFWNFYKQLTAFVQYIHQGYIQHYILKQPRPDTMSRHLWFHISRIHHEIYLPSLSTSEKKKINKKIIWDYFSEVEPAVLLFALRQF